MGFSGGGLSFRPGLRADRFRGCVDPLASVIDVGAEVANVAASRLDLVGAGPLRRPAAAADYLSVFDERDEPRAAIEQFGVGAGHRGQGCGEHLRVVGFGEQRRVRAGQQLIDACAVSLVAGRTM